MKRKFQGAPKFKFISDLSCCSIVNYLCNDLLKLFVFSFVFIQTMVLHFHVSKFSNNWFKKSTRSKCFKNNLITILVERIICHLPMFSELIPKSSIMHYSSTCLGIFFCVGKNCTNISKFILITSQCGSLKKRSYLRFQICRISISKTLAQFCCQT